ncbi:hypothetical protein AMIS_25930 [Actinoplanes missouriensis 431]|uniref:Uncharacterized protein n=1 Tax=Actinoplanes missouriensis (strain ATCC 14538 / DSM 43046 / CBS 188.64 / JCM 3121 / NBRC 102363 / NCIMB 12654 / NRRL B-3342 / UNCC 431) TaxID=512565 RepID=I0H476_ACTM4|nr:hypothetical protein AMIS_25930 [Actinoplanes missouriensis 431]
MTKSPSFCCRWWNLQDADVLLGIHLNLLVAALGRTDNLPTTTREEKAALAALHVFASSGSGYRVQQSTRPQTIGYALLDSPVALAAWMLDHDTDSYQKISRAFRGGRPSGNLTREHVLDNISLYWLTGTGESAARVYWGRAPIVHQGDPRRLQVDPLTTGDQADDEQRPAKTHGAAPIHL